MDLAFSVTGQTPVFNHIGGALDTTDFRFGGAGGSRNPTYNLSDGTLAIAGAFTWGSGSDTRFSQTGGTVNHTGTGDVRLGNVAASRSYLDISGGTFNTATANLRLGGTGNGFGYLDLSGDGVLNATSTTGVVYLANNGGSGHVTIADSAQLNVSIPAFVVGQFGGGTASLTVEGGILTADEIILGGANAASAVTADVTLNGGVVQASTIRKGASNTNTLTINGGTVRATEFNANYFANLPPVLGSGGLTFDTNTNDVTIANAMSGSGGLTKTGEGALTLTAISSYTGDTTVTGGTLILVSAFLDDDSTLTIDDGAAVILDHGIEDLVDTLVLDGAVITSGTYGSTLSGAENTNDDFFGGFGMIRVGDAASGRDLTWTGAETAYWDTAFPDLNFVDPTDTPVAFETNDNVTFDDTSEVNTVLLSGQVQAGVVTFDGSLPYIIDGASSGLAGSTSIVMNNTDVVTLGGEISTFTGPVTVNAGVLRMGNAVAFGAASGITIADGAQVDINGQTPGSIHSYTIGGDGPGGTGAIVNTSANNVFSGGGVKNLVLTADSTIGSDGGRFDVGNGGTITGDGFTLTKVGTNDMAFRGNAAGSVIHCIIEGGTVWAENTALAFGGPTGSLTIRDGARAGTFGAFTMETPVTIESGGTLHNQGNGTGTWNAAVAMAGDVTFESGGGAIVINGALSGAANVTKTGGNELTFSASSLPGDAGYTGDTIVSQGRLTLAAPALADDSNVTVADGAVLNLTHAAEDTVDTLTLGNIQVAAGVWGSAASGAPNQSDLLDGTGTLLVITAGVADPYQTWAAANGVDGDRPEDDSNANGVDNGIEFVIGGDPATFGANSSALLPTATLDDTHISFVFRRTDESAGYAPFAEYSSDFTAGWTAAEAGVDGVVIEEVDDGFGEGVDQVTVRIPRSLATGGKFFVRLRVDIP